MPTRRGRRLDVEFLNDGDERHERVLDPDERPAVERDGLVDDGGAGLGGVELGQILFVEDDGDLVGPRGVAQRSGGADLVGRVADDLALDPFRQSRTVNVTSDSPDDGRKRAG